MQFALLVLAAASAVLAMPARHNKMSKNGGNQQPQNAPLGNQLTYTFQTIDNPADLTFNQLLGINNDGYIAGYFGSGADAAHPNKGYILEPNQYLAPGHILNGNVPGSVQTQDVCINKDNVGGFWVDANGVNTGFIFLDDEKHGQSFVNVKHPKTSGTVNQILGLNDRNVAVGFFSDATGNNHGYTVTYDRKTANNFNDIIIPASLQCVSVTATGINNNNDIVGFCATTAQTTVSFFGAGGKNFKLLNAPGSTNTQALGINNKGQVVGSFVDSAGTTHGFVINSVDDKNIQFTTVDATNAVAPGGTVINGINDKGQIVGFFVDSKGFTNGVLGTPQPTGKKSSHFRHTRF
ncbi:hypothetical protein BC830DRAFT_1175296 [Chytriomyces sp. MP71]|nr:hypothetical protein BC830DRAFT_1175296 [Chytriomyces sp. MP71]